MVVLVKPQFEAGKDKVSSGGVVKDATVRQEVVDGVVAGTCVSIRIEALLCQPRRKPSCCGFLLSSAASLVGVEAAGFEGHGLIESPIKGAVGGNTEYLALFTRR
jgi:23S rRNA (cytidine1920-2'-O)/16S rRNA (cytidine1409-2'-O)-methyltransferase